MELVLLCATSVCSACVVCGLRVLCVICMYAVKYGSLNHCKTAGVVFQWEWERLMSSVVAVVNVLFGLHLDSWNLVGF